MLKLNLTPDERPSTLSEGQRRAALALAEAMIPPGRTFPGADERSLALTEGVLEHLSPWAVRAFGAAVTLIDQAAVLRTGRPFRRLDPAAQEALLQRWLNDPVMRAPLGALSFGLKFPHFDSPPVYRALGGKLNVVTNLETPRYLQQIVAATAWTEPGPIECEVVVVGTGAGGAVVGKELAERGYAVVFVEEGDFHQRDSFTGSSVQAHFDFYRGSVTLGNTALPILAGRLVGGSTAINTGSCFRTPEWVLERWGQEMGTDELSPKRMEPYFERVERILQVEEADHRASGPIVQLMQAGCDSLGWSHQWMLRNAPGCQGEGFCDFGCRTDARKSTNLSYLPPALERGNLLLTGLKAERVLLEGDRAVGIEARDRNGRALEVRARVVVFAGGALSTPLFLERQGLANGSGQLGRNLTVHPSSGVAALFDEEIRGHKHIPQGYFSGEFLQEGILLNIAQPDNNYLPMMTPLTGRRLAEFLDARDRIGGFGTLIRDAAASGTVRAGPGGLPVVRYSFSRADVDRMHRAFVLLGEMAFAAGARRLYPVTTGFPVVEDRKDFERFKARRFHASEFLATSYHPLGTARIGRDPKTSVVDLDHETHDVKGLYLVDGSSVRGPLGVNPQITIMAMATRAAERIAERLG
ncbi:MAG: GMC family oxidoreductase [Sandaracinaceae bacterium]